MRDFDTGDDAGGGRTGFPGREAWRRALLAFVLGVLFGVLLVSVLFLAGRFGAILGYLFTATATVAAGYAVGLVAGWREVPIAAISPVTGVALVAITFSQDQSYGSGLLAPSNPAALLAFGIPLAVLAASGGWIAERTRQRDSGRERPGVGSIAAPSPVVLAGTVGVALVALVLVVLFSGFLQETPAEALESAVQAANDGDYEEANGYLSSRLASRLGGDTRAFWDRLTRDASSARIGVIERESRGGTAQVELSVDYEPGGSSSTVLTMVREEGEWKLPPQEVLGA